MIVDNLEFHIKRTGDSGARGTNKLGKSLKDLGKSSGNANKGLGSLLRTMQRLAKMMVLRQAIRAVMKGLKEGLENAYKFNSIMGGEMSAALDQLKSASVQATGAIGSAFGELLATLSPILISILNLITRVANGIAQLFAVLGGRSTYTKAVASSERWADATQAGAKAAKEWRNQLMGFDEINRLEEPSDSSGAGGGVAPYEGAFELAPAVNEWASELRRITLDWWNGLNLEPLTVSWERLKKAVGDFVDLVDQGLYWAYTEVLLPFATWTIEELAPVLVENLASAFELLNTVIRKLSPYFDDFYKNVLKPFGEWIGGLIISGIKDFTETLESLTKKVEEADSLGEFLDSLDGKEVILTSLATAITAVGIAFGTWKVITGIVSSVGTAIGFFSTPVGAAITIIGLLVVAGITLYQNWDTIKAKAEELKEKISTKWAEIKKAITDKIDAVGEKLREAHEWWYEHVTKPLEDMVDRVKRKINEWKDKIEEAFGGTVIGKLLGFKNTADDTATSVSEDLAEMSRQFGNVYDNSSVLGSMAAGFEDLGRRAHPMLDDIGLGLQRVIAFCKDALSGLNAVANKNAARIEADGSQYLTGFASGGFPDEGELFMAREGGMPEMVGRIGNRTAVASNDQIVRAISDGVFSAVVSAMGSSGGGNDKVVKIYMDGREIASTTTKYQKQFARAGAM